jgi:hypothetical protein
MTRDQHSALNARDDLLAIADTWPRLLVALGRQGTGDRSGVRTKPASRPPIAVDISDVIAELTEWTIFLVRVLMEETDWKPSHGSLGTPALLRAIARERIGHFTQHPDEMLRMAFMEESARNRKTAENALKTKRRIELNVECGIVTCKGKYTMMLDPDRYGLPDMVCDADKGHRITPLEWQRASRKQMDPAAAAALAARIKGEGSVA